MLAYNLIQQIYECRFGYQRRCIILLSKLLYQRNVIKWIACILESRIYNKINAIFCNALGEPSNNNLIFLAGMYVFVGQKKCLECSETQE